MKNQNQQTTWSRLLLQRFDQGLNAYMTIEVVMLVLAVPILLGMLLFG